MTVEDYLRENLTYDGECLRWESGRNRITGAKASKTRADGYKRVRITYEKVEHEFLEHRVIWLLKTGNWPKHHLDHINGVKGDNRLENLREATSSQNGGNSKISVNNSSGWKGVYEAKGVFRAQIHYKRKTTYLGQFDCAREAALAYNYEAEKRFGPFARFNQVFEDV